MALINCPECKKEISDKAATCPSCGCPISSASAAPIPTVVETRAGGVVTTQATGKSFKGVQLAGVALVVVGFASCAGALSGSGEGLGWSLLFMIVGSLLYIGGRFGAWWGHG